MPSFDITLWGERGLVCAAFLELVQTQDVATWHAFCEQCVAGGPRFEAVIAKTKVIIEPSFGNVGFGHPDAIIRFDLENGESRAFVVEAKCKRYAKSCCLPGARGAQGYNSKLNGQLELNHCLAMALSEWTVAAADLRDSAWIASSPYNEDRHDGVRRVAKDSVMESLVAPFSGIQFRHFTHLVITTDANDPFDDPECRQYLPEIYTAESPNRSCWDALRSQFAWTSWAHIERFFRKLDQEDRTPARLFLTSLERNRMAARRSRRRRAVGRPDGIPIPDIKLGIVGIGPAGAEPSSSIDEQKARQLCYRFIDLMEANRRGRNDAGVAIEILKDLDRGIQVRDTVRRRLVKWCHTPGNPYQRGVDLARQISEALYGRVLPKES